MPPRRRRKPIPQTKPLPTPADIIADLTARAAGKPQRNERTQP